MLPRLTGAALLLPALALPALPGLAQPPDSKKDAKAQKKPNTDWQKKESWRAKGNHAGKVLAVNEEEGTIKVRVYGQTPITTVRLGNPNS